MISFDQFKYQKKCLKHSEVIPIQKFIPVSEIIQEVIPIQKVIPVSEIIQEVSPIQKVIPEIQIAIPIVECNEQNVSYIYLIREREHYLKGEPIYKFGRSTQLPDHKINRLYHYKKGSEIVMVLQCKNVIDTENKIRIMFKQNFIQHKDGHEHYYGNVNKMKKIIWDIINI